MKYSTYAALMALTVLAIESAEGKTTYYQAPEGVLQITDNSDGSMKVVGTDAEGNASSVTISSSGRAIPGTASGTMKGIKALLTRSASAATGRLERIGEGHETQTASESAQEAPPSEGVQEAQAISEDMQDTQAALEEVIGSAK